MRVWHILLNAVRFVAPLKVCYATPMSMVIILFIPESMTQPWFLTEATNGNLMTGITRWTMQCRSNSLSSHTLCIIKFLLYYRDAQKMEPSRGFGSYMSDPALVLKLSLKKQGHTIHAALWRFRARSHGALGVCAIREENRSVPILWSEGFCGYWS